MPLPGHACAFYIRGVCVHPQAAKAGPAHPGPAHSGTAHSGPAHSGPAHSGPAHHCVRLAQLLERWDDFLDRAEAFGLSEETAARIWSARMNGFVLRRKECPSPARFPAAAAPPRYAEGVEGAEDAEDAEGEALGCPHLWQGACLLALPECRGVCAQYRRRG